MDPRQRSLIAAAVRRNPERMQDRLRRQEPFATIEVAEFLEEIADEDFELPLVELLLPHLPREHQEAVLRAHPGWSTVLSAAAIP